MLPSKADLLLVRGLAALLIGTLTWATAAAQDKTSDADKDVVRVESLDLKAVEQEWGEPHQGFSVDRNPITLAGKVYEHGLGTHANSELVIELGGGAQTFEAVVGVDDEKKDGGSVVFVVLVDGREALRTKVLHGGVAPVPVKVDLAGAKLLTLVVEDGGDDINNDHADWADARITLKPGDTSRPKAVPFPPGPDPNITRLTTPAPTIHHPRITGATPGRPFLFRIPATGQRPLKFTAKDLPAGLKLDTETGIITGALQAEGTTVVTVTAENGRGKAEVQLTIVGGTHKLAATPPMGWNSWNCWGTAVDDAKVRAAADALVSSGLADVGFQYINIDDAWEKERDADGRIVPNEKFPDMKALADYVHSKGLKLGIYSSPGPKTCGGYEGSYQHEEQDARQYAEWGIDLLKYDWCSYGEIAKDPNAEELRHPYRVMRAALDKCGRDIVYSLCQYGMGKVWEWGAEVGGNYWRTTGDINDSWQSMAGIGFAQAGHEEFAGPGRWNDPDMLVVGKVGWGPDLHPTRLTKNEQVTHITLWALLAAPMLIGCDLSDMDDFTLALLTNPDVIAISQDPLGKAARRIKQDGRLEIWARPLVDGTQAVGLFNRGRGEATITVNWSALGLSGAQPVYEVWTRQGREKVDGEYHVKVPRHGAALLKIGTPDALKRKLLAQ